MGAELEALEGSWDWPANRPHLVRGGANRRRLDRCGSGVGDAARGERLGDGKGEGVVAGKQSRAKPLTAPPSPSDGYLEGGEKPTLCASNTECGPFQVGFPCATRFSLRAGAKYSARRVDSLVECLRWSAARGQFA
jgi:hypothetical protein